MSILTYDRSIHRVGCVHNVILTLTDNQEDSDIGSQRNQKNKTPDMDKGA